MPDTNLFAAFGSSTVHAGSQASGETGIVNRPPIRSIRDKDPIYSAVSVNGEESPIRVIQGPKTDILGMGYAALSTVTADPANNEIFLPVGSGGYRTAGNNGPEGVLVFDRIANGDVAPKRILAGPDTQIRSDTPHVAVDPIHNVLVVKSNGLLIFDRTAQGNTKPLRVIRGPKTGGFGGGQITVYAEKGLILTNSMDGWAVWSIYDDGDVAPRWRIPVDKSRAAARIPESQ
jgi:hypothetical protein